MAIPQIDQWLETTSSWLTEFAFQIVLTIVTLLLIWRFTLRVNRLMDSLYNTMSPFVQVRDPQRMATERLLNWLFYSIALALVLYYWGVTPAFYATLIGLSITGLVLGLAAREILANLFAGLVLTLERPFEKGDLIESGGFKGHVRGLTMRSTLVETEAGYMVRIPNTQFIVMPLVNHSRSEFGRESK